MPATDDAHSTANASMVLPYDVWLHVSMLWYSNKGLGKSRASIVWSGRWSNYHFFL